MCSNYYTTLYLCRTSQFVGLNVFFHLICIANVVLAPVIIKGISFLVIANGV